MIHIIHFGSSKTPLIAEAVQRCGSSCEIIPWMEPERTDFKTTQGIIFSGSPTYFTEVDLEPYRSRYAFVKAGTVPVLGICFGHQLMGLLHGSSIFRGKEVRTTIPVQVLKRDPLFEGLSDTTEMAEDHTEGITLPPSFIHLATSESYTIEAMRHATLPLWGIQFHPEVSGTNGDVLIGNFLRRCIS